MKNNLLKSALIFSLISACTLEPKYEKPKLDFELTKLEQNQISKISWEEFFTSEDLQRIVKLALKNNRDLRIAILNVESAQAIHGITRSALLPTVNAGASETRQGVPSTFASFTPRRLYRANLSLVAYEVDIFGRLRSLKKSALENFLATEQAKNTIKIAVIAETINSYAQLLLDRQILKIAQENLALQEKKYSFAEMRLKSGVSSRSDLYNAQTIVEGARINAQTYEKLVKQDQNALMALVGKFDEESLPQDLTINDIKINEGLLEFLPSESLLLRPDIQQAEHQLKSANANIGAARADFFPSISLTGTYGYSSRDLSNLFSSKTWSFTPQINLPIFTGGRNIANLNLANTEKKIAVAKYEKAIQTAFREVLDELAERKSVHNQSISYDKILKARENYFQIAEDKKHSGIYSESDLIDAKILLLTAQQSQAIVKKEYLMNLVSLYKVLGGGSELEDKTEGN